MPTYQPAQLSITSDTWRIEWYNLNPETNQLERIRKTFDINRIKDLQERKRVGQAWVHIVNEGLKAGYNHFIHYLGYEDTITPSAEINSLPVKEVISIQKALTVATQARTNGQKINTLNSYNSLYNRLMEWLGDNGLLSIDAKLFTAMHFQEYINYKAGEGHGNRNINDHINFFKTTLDKAVTLGMMERNPIASFTYLPKKESDKFQDITAGELEQIGPALMAANPFFYVYTKFTAIEWMRPYHVARLKAKQIDYENNFILLNDDTTKNNKVLPKELLPSLKNLLISMKYHELPGDYNLFSNRRFEPGAQSLASLSKRASELWRQVVIDGLGIKKYLYALKSTGSNYYLDHNDRIDAGWLQRQMEHGSLATTDIYIRKRKVKKIGASGVKIISY